MRPCARGRLRGDQIRRDHVKPTKDLYPRSRVDLNLERNPSGAVGGYDSTFDTIAAYLERCKSPGWFSEGARTLGPRV